MTTDERTPGQINYEAHGPIGQEYPRYGLVALQWRGLPEKERNAWEKAAQAVIADFCRRLK